MGGLGECVADEGNYVAPAGSNLTDCSTATDGGQIANARQWCTAEQLAVAPGAWNDQNALFDVSFSGAARPLPLRRTDPRLCPSRRCCGPR